MMREPLTEFRCSSRISRWWSELNEQEKLKDRLAALGQMAAGLAHEIRNPLAAIELTASLIKRKIQPTHTAQLESIQSEVRKLNKIVTDCLEYVRPVKVSPEKVNLKSLLEESLGNALSTVDREGIEIVKDYQQTPTVPIDYAQMKQVFVNIMVNALQAIGEPGKIQIACGPSIFFSAQLHLCMARFLRRTLSRQVDLAPYAWVRIEDNGQGISDEVLSKIFYPFYDERKGIGHWTRNRPEDRRQSSWQYRCGERGWTWNGVHDQAAAPGKPIVQPAVAGNPNVEDCLNHGEDLGC